jgi:hypothetical protein
MYVNPLEGCVDILAKWGSFNERRRVLVQSKILKKKNEWADFQLQYADRTDHSAADFVSEPDSLIDHGHLCWRAGQLHKGMRNPITLL